MTWFRKAGEISPLQVRTIEMVVDRISATPGGARSGCKVPRVLERQSCFATSRDS